MCGVDAGIAVLRGMHGGVCSVEGYGGVGGMVVLMGIAVSGGIVVSGCTVVYAVLGGIPLVVFVVLGVYVTLLFVCIPTLGMLSTDHTSGSWATSIDQRFC